MSHPLGYTRRWCYAINKSKKCHEHGPYGRTEGESLDLCRRTGWGWHGENIFMCPACGKLFEKREARKRKQNETKS